MHADLSELGDAGQHHRQQAQLEERCKRRSHPAGLAPATFGRRLGTTRSFWDSHRIQCGGGGTAGRTYARGSDWCWLLSSSTTVSVPPAAAAASLVTGHAVALGANPVDILSM